MKKVIVSLVLLLVVGGLLAGCEQTKETDKSVQQLQTKQSDNVTGLNNNGRGKFVKSNYVVDESDKVQPRTLLGLDQKGNLSVEEKAGLTQMREEEKLAHDVYVTLYKKWGQNIFNNISKSEQTHTDTVKYVIDKYGLADPVISTKVGDFTDPKMAELYKSLVAQGNKSLRDALTVGATVEDLDIKDLENLLLKTDNEDIKIAYQNLNKGSRNHLRAFMRNLERNGGAYTPQFISQERFDEILAGEQEKGTVNAQGKFSGTGNGQGQGHGRDQRQGRNNN